DLHKLPMNRRRCDERIQLLQDSALLAGRSFTLRIGAKNTLHDDDVFSLVSGALQRLPSESSVIVFLVDSKEIDLRYADQAGLVDGPRNERSSHATIAPS